MGRLSKDEYYLDIAKSVSKRSTCLKRQYGAVIVNNNRIISTGYNGAPHDCVNCCDVGICDRMNVAHNSDYTTCRAVHAEMNAIIQATFSEMKDSTLYLVGFDKDGSIDDPDCCPMCKRCIINAGIKKIVFGNDVGVVRNAYTHDWIADFDSKFKKDDSDKTIARVILLDSLFEDSKGGKNEG